MAPGASRSPLTCRGATVCGVRFLADGSEAGGEEKQQWNLPLLYATAGAPSETKLEMMSGETHTLKVDVDDIMTPFGDKTNHEKENMNIRVR